NILGTLGVDGAANLFLINPNGIVFGENARLDLGGSFVGTTANGLQFGEQGDFSATNPQAPGLLTVNPNALFFNQINQLSDKGNITNLARQRGLNGQTNVTGGPVGLQVPDGKTLALVGGNVLLDDGNLTTFGGKIEVGSVAGTGTVNLDSTKDGFIFNYDAVDDFGEIRLENTAVVDVSAGGGGSITINASNLELKESILLAGIRQGFGTPEAQAGDITINAVSKVLLDNQSYISNDVKFGGVGKAGDVSISTGSLEVFNGAQIGAATFGQGDAGNVTINATNLVKFDGEDNDGFASGAFSTVESDAVGKAGGISISTSSLELTNGARLSSSTFGVGNAGSVEITATDVIKFDGEGEYNFSGAFSRVETGAEGKAGGVSISTNSLEVLNGAAVSASTWGEGDAGSVEITATDLVKFDGIGEINTSGAYSPVVSGAEGNAGGIFISTGSLEVVNGARLSASTNGQGNAGNIFVRANGAVSLSNSNIFSNVEAGAEGDGGEIDINAKSLSLINGSQIQTIIRGGSETVAGGKGEAGNININVGGELALFGIDNDNFASGIFSIVQSGTEGNGGNIDITAGEISMNDGATIQSSTFGTGNAGNIQVQTSDLITGDLILENDALIAADTFSADGIGGNIKIEVGKLIANNGGQISTGSGEQFQEGNFGRGGDLVVTAFDSIELDGNGVGNTYRTGFFAETSSRNRAGDLTVNTNKLIVQNGAGISSGASGSGSLGGDGGNLVINATESIDLIGTNSNYRSALVTQANGWGNAGDMKITTSRLNVTDEAVISTLVTSGENTTNQFTIGNGGNIDITV
ncbi:MAG: filamentous hemagglutinin N-terminal domain-containing protein, partial [Cyanobacteria bacterium P01_D01_bin.116]